MPLITFHDYQESRSIRAQGYHFYALLAAIFMQADTNNLEKLREAFPGEWEALKKRYNSPGGIIPELDGMTIEQAIERGVI